MLCWTVHLKRITLNGCVAVSVGCEVYSIGGPIPFTDPDNEIDVHVFNTVTLLWKKLTTGRESPLLEVPKRWGHTAVLIEHIIYMWGGTPCGMLCAFDVHTHNWFEPVVSGTIPEDMSYHSACGLGKAMYIYGGYWDHTGATGLNTDTDIYKLDTSTMVWSLINTRDTTAPASYLHTATIIGTKMFVFGGKGKGRGDRGVHHNIRVFDTETDCWLYTPSAELHPEARRGHSAFAYNGELYIFGGNRHDKQLRNDMWKFTPETSSWKKVEPSWKTVEPMYWGGLCAMACSMVGDCAILFGSQNSSNDLLILDFSPSLKMLCKLAVIQYGLEQSELPHDIRWELTAMKT